MTRDAREFEDDGGGGEYGYVRTADGQLVRYAPYVGLQDAKQGAGGNGAMNSVMQQAMKKLTSNGSTGQGGGSGVSLKSGEGIKYDPGLGGGSGTAGFSGGSGSAAGLGGSAGNGITASGGGSGAGLGSSLGNGTSISSGNGISYSPVSEGGTGTASSGGGESSSGSSGSYTGAIIGAVNGYNAGKKNAETDPNMSNKKDGFGEHHRDYRAEIGGTIGGGVIGWYGGDIAGGFAGEAVEATHPFMEEFTRGLINTGDDLGGPAGAMILDPIGTMASGKYSWSDLAKSSILGPAMKWFD